MSALVKLPPKYRYLGLPAGCPGIRPAADYMGVHLSANKALLLSGPEAGEHTDKVKMNQLVKIEPVAPVNVSRYTILLGYNPELNSLGSVNCSAFLAPGSEISLTIKAYKNFKLDDLDYIFTLYLLD